MLPVQVLIADPDEALLEAYCEGLAFYGFKVETATDGRGCLAKLQTFAPDVIVLESELPWDQGDEGPARRHDQFTVPLVPLIVLCQGPEPEQWDYMAGLSVSGSHMKPLSPTQLAYRIALVLQGVPRRRARGTVK